MREACVAGTLDPAASWVTCWQAELAEKRARSIRYQLGRGEVAAGQELAEFDFKAIPVNAVTGARAACWRPADAPRNACWYRRNGYRQKSHWRSASR